MCFIFYISKLLSSKIFKLTIKKKKYCKRPININLSFVSDSLFQCSNLSLACDRSLLLFEMLCKQNKTNRLIYICNIDNILACKLLN